MLGQSEFNVLVDGRAASKVTMGVTTEVTGEGASIAPVSDQMMSDTRRAAWQHFGIVQDFRTLGGYFERLETRSRPAINMASFVGAGGVRDYVIGQDERAATPGAVEKMKQLVAQAMEEGALGLSTSLQYVPDRFASTDEIVELAKVARRYGGIYMTHQRSESGALDASMDEVFRIARSADPGRDLAFQDRVSGQLGPHAAALARLEAARARGSTSRPTSTHTPARRTGSTPACRSGCVRAERTRKWRG
jgi:dihydroorotase/N-acyl-D-amino-acid deacylase